MEGFGFGFSRRCGPSLDCIEQQGGREEIGAAPRRQVQRAEPEVEIEEIPASDGGFEASGRDDGFGSLLHGTQGRPASSIKHTSVRELGHDPKQSVQPGGNFRHSGRAFGSKDGQANSGDTGKTGGGFMPGAGYSIAPGH